MTTSESGPAHQRLLAPSILAGNHANLSEALDAVASHQLQWVHLDIMDGHFVPNLSFGPQTVKDLRAQNSDLFFDTHLMLDNPDQFIDPFVDAGADLITIHVEPDYDIAGTLEKIRQSGVQTGIALNPGTDASEVFPFLDQIDLVLVMTVWPGFGGQSFIEDTLPKMRQLSDERRRRHLSFRLEVDGGIDAKTAPRCAEAGADTFVAGTAFFKANDRHAFIRTIQS